MDKREKKERDQWDIALEQIDFKGTGREGSWKRKDPSNGLGEGFRSGLEREMDIHPGVRETRLGRRQHGDRRNGCTPKTAPAENQEAVIQIPRDRNGTFEPKIIPKHL
jgi:hypothetical protein